MSRRGVSPNAGNRSSRNTKTMNRMMLLQLQKNARHPESHDHLKSTDLATAVEIRLFPRHPASCESAWSRCRSRRSSTSRHATWYSWSSTMDRQCHLLQRSRHCCMCNEILAMLNIFLWAHDYFKNLFTYTSIHVTEVEMFGLSAFWLWHSAHSILNHHSPFNFFGLQ